MSQDAISQLLVDCKGILGNLESRRSVREFLTKVMSLNENGAMVLDNLFAGFVNVLEGLDEKGRVRFLAPLVQLVDTYQSPEVLNQSLVFDFKQAEEIRKTKKFTRKALAETIGIHEMSIFKMERGELRFDSDKPKHKVYMAWLLANGYQPGNHTE